MVRVLLASLGLVLALGPGDAAAQVKRTEDRGYIGRDTGTEEVDRCELDAGISDDERKRVAAEHYDRGVTLYTQGEYQGAIEEFVAAYCHAPHHSVLKDIAQAFERRFNFEKAVAYFERYILETPDSAEEERLTISFRVQVLRTTPARIRVATVPEGASVTLRSDTGVQARGVADAEEAIEIQTGTYTMTIEAPGHEPVTETIHPRIGQPYSYYFRLEPRKGTARVITDPTEARIFVDKRLVAIGNYVDRLPIGTYEVTVEARDRQPQTRELEITAGRTSTVRIELEAPPRSGRRELLIAGTVGGGIWGASAFSTIFGADTTYGSLGGLVGLGIGFTGAYYGVPRDIEVGTSSYLIGATLIGAAEGFAISSFFACDTVDDMGELSTPCNDDAIAGAGLVAAIGGLGFAAATSGRFDLDAGDAALINSGALWGSVAGGLFFTVFDADFRVRAPLLFAGLNLGLVTGATLAARYEVSRGHVALIDVSGLAGMIAGVATAGIVGDEADDGERLPHFALGGLTLGLIAGAILTRDMDDPRTIGPLQPRVGAAEDAAGRITTTLGVGTSF